MNLMNLYVPLDSLADIKQIGKYCILEQKENIN